eukprot:161456_1
MEITESNNKNEISIEHINESNGLIINNICDSVLLIVILYLNNDKEIYSFSITCKRWKKIINKHNNIIYKNLLKYYKYNNLSSLFQWQSSLLIFGDSFTSLT